MPPSPARDGPRAIVVGAVSDISYPGLRKQPAT